MVEQIDAPNAGQDTSAKMKLVSVTDAPLELSPMTLVSSL